MRRLRKETQHQPGRQGGAPVARERWIGGWEAPALARRLFVLNSAGEQYQGVLRKAGSVSNVDAGLERGRVRGVLVSKSPGTARGLLSYQKIQIVIAGLISGSK